MGHGYIELHSVDSSTLLRKTSAKSYACRVSSAAIVPHEVQAVHEKLLFIKQPPEIVKLKL